MANRNNQLAQIHIAKKELGMDDDTYRSMLWTVARVNSSRDLDMHGRYKVVMHLKALGWKPGRSKKKSPASAHKLSKTQLDKIRALWIEMGNDGIVKNPTETNLNKFAKRLTGIDRVDWLRNERQATTVIESLKKWRERVECQATEQDT